MKSLRLLSVVALALAAMGCQSGSKPDTRGIRSDGFPAPSREAVWEAAQQAMVEQRYIPDSDASSRSTGVVASRWRNSLTSFSREGFREKATIRVLPLQGRPGYFRTETNVTRQENEDVDDPSNPMKAEWADPTRNVMAENLMNRRVEMFFLPSGPSAQFRKEHGLPTADDPRATGLPQHDDGSMFDEVTRGNVQGGTAGSGSAGR